MIVFIVGGSKGIGEAIVKEFCKSTGNTIYFSYNEHKEEAEKIREYISHSGNIPKMLHLDVTDRKEIKDIKFDEKIDYLINNFGIVRDRTLSKMTDEEWDDVINTNLTGVFNVTKAFLPYINDGGCIINMGSIIGVTGNFGQCNYAASKAGVIAFTKSLAKELAKRNIRVNSISPSFVNTDMTQRLSPEQYTKVIDRMPFKRIITTEEIAKFVVFLAKDATCCTGENYIIGGLE